ncbi:deoxyribose-phosphate aldolase [uncultured Muriicola sp.]|uniref:deoxyribose-phosphate aldolase n=1 Tax=uncultured Muriicola sp. TaxID=1583102 RepID=UPI00260DF90E|nr:deoxyribose-phosphate aldolase [uncultured Muriicola sp.]
MQLNQYIDHTLLKSTATEADIRTLCTEAKKYNFYAVCVNSSYVALAKEELQNTQVKVAAVIGFPLGAMASKIKEAEAEFCAEQGADEIDMVMNLGWFKSGLHTKISEEIKNIKSTIGNAVLKVILETCFLSEDEIVEACKLSLKGGADFVKTSTGFGPEGATLKAVQLMKESVGEKARIKASGGIRDKATALAYIKAGASRIGTSSGVQMMES